MPFSLLGQGKAGISGLHSRLPRGGRPRLLVLKGLVGLHRTFQLQLLQHYWLGHRLGLYLDIEMTMPVLRVAVPLVVHTVIQVYAQPVTLKKLKLKGSMKTYKTFEKIPWRREWQPSPVFLPRELHGQRSLLLLLLLSCFSHVRLFAAPWNSLGQNTGVGSLSLLQETRTHA